MKAFALLFVLCLAAQAETRLNLVTCVKAYSDRETAQKKAQCEASAKALDAASDASLAFRSDCVTGRDAFYKHGCGIYDVAWLIELTTAQARGTESPITRCFKAYSDRETREALAKCETTAAALGTVTGDASFTVACVSGRDAFYKYGCGIYDAALTGRLRIAE